MTGLAPAPPPTRVFLSDFLHRRDMMPSLPATTLCPPQQGGWARAVCGFARYGPSQCHSGPGQAWPSQISSVSGGHQAQGLRNLGFVPSWGPGQLAQQTADGWRVWGTLPGPGMEHRELSVGSPEGAGREEPGGD